MTGWQVFPCAACGGLFPLHVLDAKPSQLLPGESLADALWRNAECDRLECASCYGPGYVALPPPCETVSDVEET